jgi:hypothetical protein
MKEAGNFHHYRILVVDDESDIMLRIGIRCQPEGMFYVFRRGKHRSSKRSISKSKKYRMFYQKAGYDKLFGQKIADRIRLVVAIV